jgi:gamma-glutamylcyclotransferase (GGCT)/AIG2-like uncharacterized protein YtfP
MMPLFVYGTLQRAFLNPFARLLWRGATDLGPARVSGKLYLIESYPGLVECSDSNQWVHGRLVQPADPETILRQLDQYEGPDYERIVLQAIGTGGPRCDVWVYVYRGKVDETRRIPSGRFTAAGRRQARRN